VWDVLWMLHWEVARPAGGRQVPFALHVRNDSREGTPPLVRLRAVCGPGDRGGPVLTVPLPGEDWAVRLVAHPDRDPLRGAEEVRVGQFGSSQP
jgi:hypothetical protein